MGLRYGVGLWQTRTSSSARADDVEDSCGFTVSLGLSESVHRKKDG